MYKATRPKSVLYPENKMASCCSFSTPALLMTGVSLVLLCIGVFKGTWWVSNSGDKLTLFASVTCDSDGFCFWQGDDNEDWATCAQATGILSVALCITSILAQLIVLKTRNPIVNYVSMVATVVTVVFAFLHVFVVITVFSSLATAYNTMAPNPDNAVWYQTLPVGLVAVGGSVCVVAVVCLVIIRLKLKQTTDLPQNKVV